MHYFESNNFGVMPLFELSIICQIESKIYFNATHYSKSVNKDINTKVGMLAHHDKYAVEKLPELKKTYPSVKGQTAGLIWTKPVTDLDLASLLFLK